MPTSRTAHLALLLLGLLLLAPAVWHMAALAQIFAARAAFPADIEWMEGGALLHAHRFLRGEPVYGSSIQGFLPYPYPPGHFVALAAVGGALGLDYWTGRAVSIAAFAVACAVLFREAYRAAGKRRGEGVMLGLIAVASAAASYPVVGSWYDICRNDSLAIALVLLGASMLSDERLSRRRILAASAVLTAAVFTKQTAVFFIGWLGVFLLVRRYPSAIVLGLSTATLSLATLAALQVSTGGMFWIYTVRNLARHPVDTSRALAGAVRMLEFAPFLPLAPVLALVLARLGRLRWRTALWLGMLAAAFPAALLPYIKAGGFLNNLIPIGILAGPAFALLVYDVIDALSRRVAARALVRVLVLALASAFLWVRKYEINTYIPSQNARQQTAALNAFIASLEGGVLIPNHPFLAVRNGQPTPQFHSSPYWDVMTGRLLRVDVPGFLQRTAARWVIMSGVEDSRILGWVYQQYAFDSALPATVKPMVGYGSVPRTLLKRRRPVKKQDVRVVFDFERGTDGWRFTGEAFEMGARGAPGAMRLTSYHPEQRDAAMGKAFSPAFTLDRPRLGFQIGGGRFRGTRVELHVDGKVRFSASGVGSDVLFEVHWDVRKFQGREATLVLIDTHEGEWGHVTVDQVELFDEAAPEP